MKKSLYLGVPVLLALILFSCRKLFWDIEHGILPQHGTLLSANGPGNTYELIDSVLGGGAYLLTEVASRKC